MSKIRQLLFIFFCCLSSWFTNAQALTKTNTNLVLSTSTITANQTVTLSAAVKPNAARGTIRFVSGNTNLGTATLNSTGIASLPLKFSTPGNHNLIAVYSGNSIYASSTSQAMQFTVKGNTAASTLVLDVTPTSSMPNETITVKVAISPVSATGNITFKDGIVPLGSVNLNAGIATLSTSFSKAGQHTLSASFSGNDAISASNSNVVILSVANPIIALPDPASSPTPALSQAYNAQGNPTVETRAPDIENLALTTSREYDALGRTKRLIDSSGNSTVFSYTTGNQVSSVYDGIGAATQFDRDGSGQITQQHSPDTGTTRFSYDAAGNVLTTLDDRGVLATNTYDAINRLTESTFSQVGQTNQTYAWTYDQTGGNFINGIGRLTTINFPEGSTAYAYNDQGRLTNSQLTLHPSSAANPKAIILTTVYEYDAAGNLSGITYPSGRKLQISYVSGLPNTVSLSKDPASPATPLVTELRYAPFGTLQSWKWVMKNGLLAHNRVMDTNGRMVRYPLGDYLRDVSYDEAGRVTSYTHYRAASGDTRGSIANHLDQQFTYNGAGRLTKVTTIDGNWIYGYDANGNRMSVTINNSTTTGYNFKNNSNQLTSINKPFTTLAYDEIGNTVSDSNFKLQYDLRGRLAKITGAQGSFSYSYDNNGLRIRKSNGSAAGTKIFAYNTEGNILGEYDGSGNPIQEIIWLGNMPLAIFTPDSTTGANSAAAFPQLFYIHSDHLNTPRVVVDKFNVLRWRWISEPFGTTTAETSPAGQADLLFNLRFPGQYYDAESGMHQNWNRDYIPGLGRYAESDPIGLSGGNNTYSYVGANPISYTDKLGLATDEEIRKAVATLRCANRKEFEILAKSIIMANMGENGSGMTDWNNNITLNSGLYGDEKTPTDEFIRSEFLQTLAHELLHVNQGLGGKIITRIRMGNPLGVLHRQLDSKAEAMITSQLLDQYNKALQNGDSGCTCSR